MQEDDRGFRYPVVDAGKCTGCGLCAKACPENQPRLPSQWKCFYVISDNQQEVRESSSGAVFSKLASRTLSQGGVVVGVAFTPDFQATMQTAETQDELSRLRMSKYVQAAIPADLFPELGDMLEQGRQMLFTGTPCQIAAFRSYLNGQDHPNLVTAEVVCHGVPSPRVWKSYLEHVLQGCHAKTQDIESILFRDKEDGWHDCHLTIKGRNGMFIHERHGKNEYMKLFNKNVSLRPSCFDCRFKAGRSGADISMGDFWGLGRHCKELDNNTGISLIIVHNPKAEEYLRNDSYSQFREIAAEAVEECNPCFLTSVRPHRNTDRFFQAFKANHYRWMDPELFVHRHNCRIRNAWYLFRRFLVDLLG